MVIDHEMAILIYTKRTLTTTVACGLQICCDFTWILIKRVIRLDKTVSRPFEGAQIGKLLASYPDIHTRMGASCGIDLSDCRARKKKQGHKYGRA